MRKNKTPIGFYYITDISKPEQPIEKFDDLFYACNTAAWYCNHRYKSTSVWQWDKHNDKPVKLTSYVHIPKTKRRSR